MTQQIIKMKIENHRTKVICAKDVERAVSETLSYLPPGAEHQKRYLPPHVAKNWDGRVKLLKRGFFPTGLLDMVTGLLEREGLEFEIEDLRVPPEANTIAYDFNPPDTFKERAYQEEGIGATDANVRGVIVIGTGGGKGYMMARTIANRGVPTLVCAPDIGIREQLHDDFSDWFGRDAVSMKIESGTPIVVSNIGTLARRDMKYYDRFKMLITDEFHHCLRGVTEIEGTSKKYSIEYLYNRFHSGDKRIPTVKSWDGEEFVYKKITNAFRYKSPKKLKKITIEDEDGKQKVLFVTDKHDIYTRHHFKVPAGEIVVGDEIALGYTTHKQAMRNRSANPAYRKYLSDRMKKKNPAKTDSFKKNQSKKIKALIKAGTYNPYGRGKYGNGGKMTPAQAFLHRLLPDTVPEFTVAPGDGEHPYHYKIDLAFPDLKVGIEVDGSSHRGKRLAADRRKEKRLAAIGWKIIRVDEYGIRKGM